MSDYTPTTEEVSKSYVWFRDQAFTDEKLKAELDRWLAEVKKLAVADFFTENGLSYRARALKAKAWEEGHSVGLGDALFEPEDYTKNPYRSWELE